MNMEKSINVILLSLIILTVSAAIIVFGVYFNIVFVYIGISIMIIDAVMLLTYLIATILNSFDE